jgi:hypothetical protein
MNKIYILIGSTGSYDDYSAWSCKAFYKKEDAIREKEEYQNYIDKYYDAYSDLWIEHCPDKKLKDLSYVCDGVEYKIEETELY